MTDTTASVGLDRGFGRRWLVPVMWSIGAQALSSTTNFGLTILLATTAATDDLGRILAVVSVYLLALTLSRSLSTEPMVAAAGDLPTSAVWAATRQRLLRMAMVAMPATTAVGIGLGMGTGSDRLALPLVVLALPALLLQDGQRYLAWATGHPRVPAVLDGCWLVVSATIVGVVVATPVDLESEFVVGAWSAGGVVSWLTGRWVLRRIGPEPGFDPPGQSGPAPMMGPITDPAPPPDGPDRYRVLARSQAVMTVAVNLGPVVLALLVSATATATMKLTLVPFTVMLSLFAGLRVVTLPAVRRAIDRDGGSRAVGLLVGSAATIAAVGGLVSIRLVRLLEHGPLITSFELVDRHLGVGALIGVLYVVGQQLADAAALAGRPAVVGRRLVAVGAEWSGVLAGAAIGGIDGMILGWAGGLTMATMIWVATWLHRPRRSSAAIHRRIEMY